MRRGKWIEQGLVRFKTVLCVLSGLFVLMCFLPAKSFSDTVTATATGSLTPPTATYPDTVTNGDFMIFGSPARPLVGDGVNDATTWTFDFSTDPHFPFFSTSVPLKSSLLTLTLTPRHRAIGTDLVRIEGLANIGAPQIQGLPVDVTNTIQLELLDFYTSSEILGVFTAAPYGQIPMVYGDDALVSFAQLELTSVPEPSTATLFLSSFGLIGLARLGKSAFGKRRMV